MALGSRQPGLFGTLHCMLIPISGLLLMFSAPPHSLLLSLPPTYVHQKKLLQFRFLSFFYTHGPPLPRDFLTLLSINLTFLPQFYVEVSWVVAWNQIRKWESDMYVQFLYFVTLIKFLKFTFYLLIQKLVVTISTYIIVERIRWNDRCELPSSVSCI